MLNIVMNTAWLVDSGASHPMSPVSGDFDKLVPSELKSVYLADDSVVPVIGKGDVYVKGVQGITVVKDVQFVPALSGRLLSLSTIYDRGGRVDFDAETVSIYPKDSKHPVLIGTKDRSAWTVDAEVISDVLPFDKPSGSQCLLCSGESPKAAAIQGSGPANLRAPWDVWHSRLGHVGLQQLKRMAKQKLVSGLELLGDVPEHHDCSACLEGKMQNLPFGRAEHRASQRFDRIHVDLMGKMEVESANSKSRYVLTIKDEATRYGWIFFLRRKSEAVKRIKRFFRYVKTQFGLDIKGLRSDRGREFFARKLSNWLDRRGVTHQLTVPYTPQQNGVAERYNRTLCDKARAVLFHAHLPKRFWEYALRYANWCANRVPTTGRRDCMAPYQALYDRKPDVSMAKVFGCLAHVWIPDELRRQGKSRKKKFDPRSQVGVFLGISEESKGWVFWIPESGELNRVSRNAYFHETKFHRDWKREQQNSDSVEPEEVWEDPFPVTVYEYHVPKQQLPAKRRVSFSIPPRDEVLRQGESQTSIPPSNNELLPTVSNNITDEDSSSTDDSESENSDSASEDGSTEKGERPNLESGTDSASETDSESSSETSSSSPSQEPESVILREVPELSQRPVRNRHPPVVFSPTMTGSHVYRRANATNGEVFAVGNSLANIKIPRNVAEANRSPESHDWLEARLTELERLEEMGAWEMVQPPPGVNILAALWVFVVKRKPDNTIDKFKARLVVNGSGQKYGLDYGETFASTAGRSTLRMFLAMVCCQDMHLHQLDVTTAFLYGFVDKEIYMRQPPGHSDGSGKVLRLVRSLYGLKQAPRIWSETLSAYLLKVGFIQSDLDPSLYSYTKDGVVLWLLDFVDDMLLACVSLALIDHVKAELMKEYKMTDLGVAEKYVGVYIHRDLVKGEMWLHQATYCLDMLEKFGLAGKPFPDTPLPAGFILHYQWESLAQGEDSEPPEGCKGLAEAPLSEEDKKRYQRIVGSLNYAAHVTRLDAAYAVSQLSRATQNPRPRHMAAAERCVQFLAGTADWGLYFSRDAGMYLECYADASPSAVNHLVDKYAHTGFVLQVAGGPVVWSSKRQDRETSSTCDSESQAVMTSTQYVEHARDQLEEFGFIQKWPTPVFNDNTATVCLSKDQKAHNKSIQLTKPMSYVRKLAKRGVIAPMHVRTSVMPADILTKRLAREPFERCRWFSGMGPLPPEVLTLGATAAVQGGVLK
jgi:transposase InsO family protein